MFANINFSKIGISFFKNLLTIQHLFLVISSVMEMFK